MGGGVSGLSAAVAAARNGSKVILVEQYGFLGGLATTAMVGSVAGAYYTTENGTIAPVNKGFAEEFISRLKKLNGLGRMENIKGSIYIPYSHIAFKIACDQFIESEPAISLMLHSNLTDVKVTGSRIISVTIQTRSVLTKIKADAFIDSSGDAALSLMAKVPMQRRGKCQYPSMMFTVNNVDLCKAKQAGSAKLSKILIHENMFGGLNIPRSSGLFFETGRPGEVVVSMTRITGHDNGPFNVNSPEDVTFGEIEGRRQALKCFDLLRKKMPGFENSYISDTAPQIGIRESRKISGRYLLTREDILAGRTFKDGIAWGAWPIELHSEDGKTEWIHLKEGLRYQIPYRSLCPGKIENLLVAGRCISASYEAMGSCRVIGSCLAMGESAGAIASYLALKKLGTSHINHKNISDVMKR